MNLIKQFCLPLLFSIALLNNSYPQQSSANEGNAMPNSNDILKLQFNKGKVFRTSTAARLALPNIKGMMVYDTMTHSFWYNNGSSWQSMDDYELFAPALVKHTGELNKKMEVLMDENHELRYQLKVLMQNMKKP